MAKKLINTMACPLVICNIAGEHEHEYCPWCGALEYGNMLCQNCVSVLERRGDLLEITTMFRLIHKMLRERQEAAYERVAVQGR